MTWALRNFGLSMLGLCILMAAVSITLDLQAIEKRMDRQDTQLARMTACTPLMASALER